MLSGGLDLRLRQPFLDLVPRRAAGLELAGETDDDTPTGQLETGAGSGDQVGAVHGRILTRPTEVRLWRLRNSFPSTGSDPWRPPSPLAMAGPVGAKWIADATSAASTGPDSRDGSSLLTRREATALPTGRRLSIQDWQPDRVEEDQGVRLLRP